MATFQLRSLTEEEKKMERPVPGDLYLDAEVVKVEERKLPFQDRQGNDLFNLEFTFKILDEEYYGKWLRGEVRAEFKLSDRCQLRDWVQELFQQELQEGFSLDTDMLVGKRCRVRTFVKSWKDKNDGTDKSTTIVNDVMRSTGGPAPQTLPSNAQQGDLEPF
jgi:hypothetical protein